MKPKFYEPIKFNPEVKAENVKILHIPAAIGNGDPGGSTDPEKGGHHITQMLLNRGLVRFPDGVFRPKKS